MQEVLEKKAEIEKAFALDDRLEGRLDDSGEGTLGQCNFSLSLPFSFLSVFSLFLSHFLPLPNSL